MKTMKTPKKKPADLPVDSLLEKRLSDFSANKSKENYIRLLDAFHCTDVLIPSALPADELPFGNEGVLAPLTFKPEIIFFKPLNKNMLPLFSNRSKIPDNHAFGKTFYMHCSGWINVFYSARCDGVILNPFSELSFVLTPDQIRLLSQFKMTANDYR